MGENLMSDERHEHLLKAAADTVGLMNVGVDPSAALAKVAADEQLNDNEVEVVAHAVNNSRQLAHLQSSSGGDREGEFPLIDPEKVRAYGECQPTTNADVNTGSRYGQQDTPGDNDEAKIDAPDAPETQEELLKSANTLDGDYRLRPTEPDYLSILRADWGLAEAQPKLASYENPTPFAPLTAYDIAISDADMRYTRALMTAESNLDKLAHEVRRIDAPEWSLLEKAAAASDVSRELMDILYDRASLEKFDTPRHDWSTKLANHLKVSSQVTALLGLCKEADEAWQDAVNLYAAGQIMRQRKTRAEDALFPKEAGVLDNLSMSANMGDIAGPLESAPADYTGLSREAIQEAIGGGEPSGDEGAFQPPQALRQEMKNTDARAALGSLMSDQYIGGHTLPEVVDAYDAAMSVNPNFGQAELVSYVRQHLATQGAVPLDLQIRARGKGEG